jgi:hypothetical protein
MYGINVNMQGIVDALVADMQKTPEQKQFEGAVVKNVVVKLNAPVRDEIDYYESKIKALQDELDGPVKNAKAIEGHQRYIDWLRL